MLWTILIILLVFALIGAPGYGPWQHNYGWGPSGGLGIIVLILVIWLLFGGRLG